MRDFETISDTLRGITDIELNERQTNTSDNHFRFELGRMLPVLIP